MTLPELSIQRHVLAYMLSGVLVLFGIISFQGIGVDRYPVIEFPSISVTTTMAGANPDIVDSSITNLVETAVNSISGVNHVQSSSSPGASVVVITFNLTKDVDVAFNEVQAKVNQVLRELPVDADPPVVAKVEFGADPIIWLMLQGDRTLQQLNQYASNVIKKRLENIDGVAEITIGGKRDRTIRVNLDTERMAAMAITTQDLLRAFNNEHFQLPGGYLVGYATERLIKLDQEFHAPVELAQLIVSYRDDAPVRLRDIAEIEDGLEDYREVARFNGEPAVGIGVVKLSDGNAVAIAEELKRRLDAEIIPQLPPGMTLKMGVNSADLIEEIVASLEEHLIEATILTALVVWLFLKSIRATLIISAAIPVSLLGAVAVMFFAGYTFNTMTLLALLLLIGVVVDDAIVVLENIYRHREEGNEDAKSAALLGTNQVVFAVMAATLTLVAIFAPVIFMEGIIGRFFEAFAVVVSVGVLVSLFVSLTLTPMLCSRHLKVTHSHGRVYHFLDRGFHAMDELYRRLLNGALRFRWSVIIVTLAVVYSSGFFFANIGKGFMPLQDEGRFLVSFKTPLGSNLEYTNQKLKEIEALLERHLEIDSYFSTIGMGDTGQANRGTVIIKLTPEDSGRMHQYPFMDKLRVALEEIPGVQAFPAPVPMVGGQRGEPLQFVLTGPNLDEVARYSAELQQQLSAIPILGRVDMDLQLDLPQLNLEVDRTRAANVGLSSYDVAIAINLLAGGLDVAKYNDEPGDGERYDVRLKAQEGQFRSTDDLRRIYLRGNHGELVRLDTIAHMEESLGAAVVPRFDLQYSGNFYATPTVSLGEAVIEVEKAAAELLPLGYQVKMIGRAEEFAKTAKYMAFAFITAIVLVYMVLASQFNSFIQPLIIMVAQPLAIVGGAMGLWLMNMSLNIFSMIGLVLLVGLVAKNSILLVDLTNQLRSKGKEIDVALKEACPVRMRPVLMTSLTIILALLPAAIGLGAGADTNGPLAVAVIGGLISSTLLTLVVVPAVYSLVENGIQRFRSRGKKQMSPAAGDEMGGEQA